MGVSCGKLDLKKEFQEGLEKRPQNVKTAYGSHQKLKTLVDHVLEIQCLVGIEGLQLQQFKDVLVECCKGSIEVWLESSYAEHPPF